MSKTASILSGNAGWVAGIVVAMGVSVYALVASGVLNDAPPPVAEPETQTTAQPTATAPAPAEDPAPATLTVDAETDAAPDPEPEDTAADESAADTTAVAEPEASDDASQEAAAPYIAPTFDLVRVDADGNTVIAGSAAASALIVVLLDAAEIAETSADAGGKFAAVLAISPSDQPRVLRLLERRDDGDILSEASVIVAPVAAPPPVETAQDAPQVAAVSSAQDTPSEEVAKAAEVAETTQPQDTEPKVESAEASAPKTPTAPAVIVSDSEGVRVVQPAAPSEVSQEVLEAVSIDAISYTDTGAVLVSGRGTAGLFVRLYLDNALSAETAISEPGKWSTQLDDVAGGLYELRVDEVDSAGKVVSRVATPFKRETPETVARARAQAELARAEQVAAAETQAEAAVPTAQEPVAEPQTDQDDTAVAAAVETTPAPEVLSVAPAAEAQTPATETEVTDAQPAPVEAGDSGDTGDGEDLVAEAPVTEPAPTPVETSAQAADAAEAQAVETTPSAAPEVDGAAPQAPVSATNSVSEPVANVEEKVEDAAPVQTEPAPAAPATQPDAQPQPSDAPVSIVTVQPGSSLWAIARDSYGEGLLYLRLFEANKEKIRDPNLIYPGQVFAVPKE